MEFDVTLNETVYQVSIGETVYEVTLSGGGGGGGSGAVDSVNGQTGIVILTTDNIPEGALNEYFTEARANASSEVVANTAARHAESHTIASHDTTATGPELDTLTDGSNADALHSHTGGGTTDPDAIHDNVADEIAAITTKTVPDGSDFILIEDSSSGNVKKKITVGTLPTGGGGEANTASNQGSGSPIFIAKNGIDLEFNSIKSANTKLTVSVDGITHDVELTVDETQIDHDQLTNFSVDEHRTINDSGAATTDLWSADKIGTDLGGKSDIGHGHLASDVSDFDSAVANAGAIMDSDISEDEGFLRKTGAGAYEAIKTNLTADVDPDSFLDGSNNGYAVGSRWVNNATAAEWICVDDSPGAAVWKETTSECVGDPDQNIYETFNGDSGTTTANSPHDSLYITGGTGLTTIGSDDQIRVSLDDTAVIPAAYTNADITVDQQGRITAAASGTGGSTDVDAIHDNVPSEIAAILEKGAPVSTDMLVIEDSENLNNKKMVQLGNLPAGAAEHGNHSGDVTSVGLVTTIPSGSISYIKIQGVTTQRILGRNSVGTGIMEEMDATTVLAMLGVEAGATPDQTGAEIKALYEAEPDTNAFTDGHLNSVGLNIVHRVGDGSDHADVAANTAARHAELHTVASHSDTTATGAELDTLTDGSNADALHVHAGGSGDVTGPASSTDNAIARFDLTTGKIIQNSGVLIDDSDKVTFPAAVVFDAIVAVSGTGAQTVDFNNGNKAQLTQTGDVNLTLTYPGIGNYVLVVVGSANTLTWPVTLKFPGGIAPDVSTDCLVGIYYDGTNGWATYSESMG